jgi:hypothetical protein
MISRHLASARSAAMAALAGMLLSACGGGGGGGGQPPPASVTISGQITFDRIPFDAVLGNGLNPTGVAPAPARQVTVQAIAAQGGAVLATTTTDTSGNYSLSVASNTNMFIRARAEMIKTGAAPTWNFSVRNNTTVGANDALYAVDGNSTSSGTANSTRNLNAPSGFGTTNYTGERAAASFAILDTVFRAKELVLSAAPNTVFPELRLFWSEDNRPTAGRFCLDDGDIGTSSYVVRGPPPLDTDDCGGSITDGIYILGDFTAGDTDEFDQSVIVHEFGHYFEDLFSRSDSIGGGHGGAGDLLDLRVAFGEGWGNAFSSMARGDAVYRDSQQGINAEFAFSVEADDPTDEGWFSEASVQEILWDLFDPANEPGDTVALGFTPLFTAMTGAQVTTDALTSIYTFSTALRATTSVVDDLLEAEQIFGTDDFGAAESNNGGDAAILPVYKTILLGPPISVCSRSPGGNADSNKLGNRVFLRFDNDATRLVTITAQGFPNGGGTIAAEDPDIFVLRRGALAEFGVEEGGTETIDQVSLPAGIYIIEVFDFNVAEPNAGTQPRCMTVSVTGS